MSFASPGVSIKEVDLTPTVNVSDQNVAIVAIAATSGPVDTVTYITSETELREIFGEPNNYNYESWFAASTVIQYGGIVGVIRPSYTSGSNKLKSAYAATTTLTDFIIKSDFDYSNYSSTAFQFAGRTAGTRFNSIKVVAVDHGVDQVLTYTGTALTGLTAGDAIYIDNGTSNTGAASATSKGWIYKHDSTNKKLYITLDDTTKKIPTTNVESTAAAGTGTITATTSSATVNGVGTDFLTSVYPGYKIYNSADVLVGTVLSVTSNTQLTLTANGAVAVAGAGFKIAVVTGYGRYEITDNAATPVVLLAPGRISAVDNTYYETLEYASGLKWKDVAPQPGTSYSVASKGGKYDEMHILVIDEEGTITGTANTILEKFLYVSKAKDASTLDGALVYFHTTMSLKSKYVYPGYDTGIDFLTSSNKIALEVHSGTTLSQTNIGETNSANKLYRLISDSTNNSPTIGFSLGNGTDYTFSTDLVAIESALVNAYELVRDSETFNDVDFLIPGSISSEKAAKLIDIAESRKDCMAVISPRRSDVLGSESSTVKTENIISFFSGIASSSYVIFDSGYKYVYDKYNDTYRYIPCAADVAGLCINSTINSETWFSPAGYNRGNLRNATKLAYSPKQSERDRLYSNRINPIVAFPGQGIVLFGDKTGLSSPSAFNRINVRRLFIELEKNIGRFAKFQLFELNDEVTRSSFKAAVEPYLRNVQGRRGIYDFLVVCDESNNTPDVIDSNEMNAEIYIKPARSINFITITFVATRTGVSFGELVN